MRVRWYAGFGLATVVALTGCKTGSTQTTGTPAAPGGSVGKLNLAKTPDINTPPPKGRYTLRLAHFVTDNLASVDDVARLQAEAIAKALREHDIPAFILTRSIPRPGSRTDRVPMYYVCVGAFNDQRTDEAQTVLASFRQMKVDVGTGEKLLFQGARFILLDTAAGGPDSVVELYEVPEGARFALAVGLFSGAKHKELARAYALKLRDQGQKPLIQENVSASLVLIGASEFKDAPALTALAAQFPKVEHNLVSYIAFQGVYGGATDDARAAAVVHDLTSRGYSAFAERLQLQSPMPGVTIFESRAYVVRRDSGNYSPDDLRRAYADIQPYNVGVPDFRATVVDLTKGAFDVRVKNTPLVPGVL